MMRQKSVFVDRIDWLVNYNVTNMFSSLMVWPGTDFIGKVLSKLYDGAQAFSAMYA